MLHCTAVQTVQPLHHFFWHLVKENKQNTTTNNTISLNLLAFVDNADNLRTESEGN